MATNSRTTHQAPRKACIFACPDGAVRFADDGDAKGRFRVLAYDGGVTQHWYWGNFAIDLAGLSFATKPLPILDSHYTNSRIGVTTEQKIDGRVEAEGRFLGNARAQELREDMADGFPMQASLSGRPSVIEQVAEGDTVEVNGHTLKGPGAVWRRAAINEISMCVFGALKNTRSTAFDADDDTDPIEYETIEGDTTMSDKKETVVLTAETFAADHPDLFAAIREAAVAEGAKAEKGRFTALKRVCDDPALLVQGFTEGWDETRTLKEMNKKLTEQVTELSRSRPDATSTNTDAATAEFVAQPPPKGQEAEQSAGPATFMEAVEHYRAEHKCTEAEAVDKCVTLYPALHDTMTGRA